MEVVAHLGRLILFGLMLAGPVPLVAAALRASGRDLLTSPFGSAYLVGFLLWSVAQVTVGLLLGLAQQLNLPGLIVGEVVLLVGGWMWWRRATGESLRPLLVPSTRPSVAQGSMLFALGVVALALAWVTLARCTRNFDSLAYHLPIMARWMAEGSFARFDELGQTSRYPLHWELVSALFFLPWRQDTWIAVPNLLAWLHLGLGVHVLARRLGASVEAATAAAILLLTMPTLLDRVAAIQPDIAVAAFFVTAIACGVAALRTPGSTHGVYALLALGLLIGLKTSALGYVALALLAMAILGGAPWGKGRLFPSFGPRWIGLAAVIVFVAAFWYVRNWIQLGNPLGLVQVKLAGATLFDGTLDAAYLRRTTIAALFDAGQSEHWGILRTVARNWLGVPFALLMAPAVSGGWMALGQRRLRRRHAAFVLFVGLLTFILYWNSPYSGDNGTHGWRLTTWINVGLRYGYPCLVVLAVAGALGMKALRLPAAWLAPLPVVSCVIYAQLTLTPGIWPTRWSVLVALGALVLAWRPFHRRRLALAAYAVIVVAGASWLATAHREGDRQRVHGDVVRFLEENVDAHATLGAVNAPKLYPLFGEGWTRTVSLVEPTGGNRDQWVRQLDRDGIETLVIGMAKPQGEVDPGVPRAQAWVKEGRPFELWREYDSVRADLAVYRLKR